MVEHESVALVFRAATWKVDASGDLTCSLRESFRVVCWIFYPLDGFSEHGPVRVGGVLHESNCSSHQSMACELLREPHPEAQGTAV